MTDVALATLRADCWTNILSAVNVMASTLGVSTVTGAFPAYDKLLETKFPIIVISNARSEKVAFKSSVNNQTSERDVVILIDVYTKKNVELDTITDGLCNYFEANEDTLFGAKAMYWLEVEESEPNQIQLEQGNRLHNKTITIMFKIRI